MRRVTRQATAPTLIGVNKKKARGAVQGLGGALCFGVCGGGRVGGAGGVHHDVCNIRFS